MIRRLWLALFVAITFVTAALAAPPQVDQQLFWGNGKLPGASIDLNFAKGQYWGTSPSQFTVSRASTDSEVCNGALTTFPANTAAITPGCGLWVWEARTNSIRNSTMAGAVPGTPGTLPNNWPPQSVAANGVAFQSLSTFVSNGFTVLPLRAYASPPTAATYFDIADFDSAVAITYGQTYSLSLYWSLSAGSVAPLTNGGLRTGLYVYDIGMGYLGNTGGGWHTPTSAAIGSQRIVDSFTAFFPTAAYVRPYVTFQTVNGQAFDFTLQMAQPQLELTPNLPASVASAVKAADGAGGVNGSGVYYVAGGTCSVAPGLNVTWAAGVLTVNGVAGSGTCTVMPPSPATLIYGAGAATGWTGATVNLTPTDNSAKGSATGPILTSAGAVTRAASNISAIVRPCSAPSLLATATPFFPDSSSVYQYIMHISDGTTANRGAIFRSTIGQGGASFITASVSSDARPAPIWTRGVMAKLTGGVVGTTLSAKLNGADLTTASEPNGPTTGLTLLNIGSGLAGVSAFNGVISRSVLACGTSLLNN